MTSDWPVVGQFSSVGSLGTEPTNWLTSEWLESFSQCKRTTMKKLGGLKAVLKLVHLGLSFHTLVYFGQLF